MLGRQVGSSLLRLPTNARLVLRPSLFECQQSLISRTVLNSTHRYYASTPGRPKKAVGEPSRPVKRSVKRGARSNATGEAGDQVAANKRQARAKKTTAKKAAPKKPKKKVLTDKQKAVKEAGVARAKIEDLKKAALDPPKSGATSAYLVFMAEKMKEGDKPGTPANVRERFKNIVDEWKRISPAELEHYNHITQQHRQAHEAEYQRWLKSHTPEQIQLANRARNLLRRRLNVKKNSHKYGQIKDERLVKQPMSSFLQFSMNRQASGDFRGIRISERAKLIGQEWRALSESEKNKYKNLAREEHSRYRDEYNHVFGQDPPTLQASAAAA